MKKFTSIVPFILLPITLSQISVFSQAPTNGLVGYWPFNGNANDLSGFGNNGTVSGATLTTDRFGAANSAYGFNGISDFIQIANSSQLNLTDSLTISFWINSTNVGVSQRILDKSIGGTSNGYLIDLSANPSNVNQIRCILGGAITNIPYSNPVITQNNVWYQVAITYNMRVINFYINGTLNGTSTLSSFTPTTSLPLILGAASNKSAAFFGGKIDDLRIYNRVLSASEISASYYDDNTGLVAHYPFNGNAKDASGNGNHGTVNGAILTTDRFGKANSAYSFDGINQSISFSNMFIFNQQGDCAISLWLKNDIILSQIYSTFIYSRLTNSQDYDRYNFYLQPLTNNTQNIRMTIDYRDSQNNLHILNTSNSLLNHSWNNLIIVRIGLTYNFYLNGVLSNTIVDNSPNLPTQKGWMIGNNPSVPRSLKGSIDDISIYNRSLSQNEITALYNESICSQSISVTDTLKIKTTITNYNPITYQNTIKIYPNPAKDQITIDYGNFASLSGSSLKIFNTIGQAVFTASITQQQSVVNLSSLGGNGVYFVRLLDASGNTVDVKKIVVE